MAYDGSGFHGFAVQPRVRTVGGAMVAALERYLRHTVEITCAGRTDTGVHAWGQVITFWARADVDVGGLQRALNRTLRPTVVVRDAVIVDDSFDARHSAIYRRYRYSILNQPLPDPFAASTSWHISAPLDLAAMRLASDALLGEHDFSAFCRRPPVPEASLVRVVRDVRWVALGEGRLRFEIEASSFCHQMVRSVVGTLARVGMGKLRAGEMTSIIRTGSRSQAGQLAPAHGLCLWEVGYPEPI